MDSHEKLAELLSGYLDGETAVPVMDEEVVTCFHALGLTEFASRGNYEDALQKKIDELDNPSCRAPSSSFARDFIAQEKREIQHIKEVLDAWFLRQASE